MPSSIHTFIETWHKFCLIKSCRLREREQIFPLGSVYNVRALRSQVVIYFNPRQAGQVRAASANHYQDQNPSELNLRRGKATTSH